MTVTSTLRTAERREVRNCAANVDLRAGETQENTVDAVMVLGGEPLNAVRATQLAAVIRQSRACQQAEHFQPD